MLTQSCLLALIAPPSAPLTQPSGDWPMWGRDQSATWPRRRPACPTTSAGRVRRSDATRSTCKTTERQVDRQARLAELRQPDRRQRTHLRRHEQRRAARPALHQGDRSAIYCLDEKTGELALAAQHPQARHGQGLRLGVPRASAPRPRSTATASTCSHEPLRGPVPGRRAAWPNGNQGYADEAQYLAGPGKPPMEVKPTDGDILWLFNMIDECGVFPHNITSSAVLVAGDHLWVTTSNGVDYGHVETPAPFAPSLIVLDKHTGALLGEEAAGLGAAHLPRQLVARRPTSQTEELEYWHLRRPRRARVRLPPEPVEGEDGFPVLAEAWRFDANQPEYRVKDGKPSSSTPRATGPSEVLARRSSGTGASTRSSGRTPSTARASATWSASIPSGGGDVTATHAVWSYDKINRSLSTLAITDDGLLFAADFSGFVYCLDARTGKEHWVHDTHGAHLGLAAGRRRQGLHRQRGRHHDDPAGDGGARRGGHRRGRHGLADLRLGRGGQRRRSTSPRTRTSSRSQGASE